MSHFGTQRPAARAERSEVLTVTGWSREGCASQAATNSWLRLQPQQSSNLVGVDISACLWYGARRFEFYHKRSIPNDERKPTRHSQATGASVRAAPRRVSDGTFGDGTSNPATATSAEASQAPKSLGHRRSRPA